MNIYSFEKLECWQQARKLAVWIYSAAKKFQTKEKLGLIMQMRRSAISIASNLAEGRSRKSAKVQFHFSTMANGSTIELLNDLMISNDFLFLSDLFYTERRQRIERQTLLIAQFRKSQRINPKLA